MSGIPVSVTLDPEDYRIIQHIIEQEPDIRTKSQALVWALRQSQVGGRGGGDGGARNELSGVVVGIYEGTPLVPGTSRASGGAAGRRMEIRSLEHSCKLFELDVQKKDLVGLGFEQEAAEEILTDRLEAKWL